MPDQPQDQKDGLLELFKKLWLPIAGFLGAITLAYNFYKLWLGDHVTVTYFLFGGGGIVLLIVLVWVGFSKRTIYLPFRQIPGAVFPVTDYRYSVSYRRVSRVGLSCVTLFFVAGTILLVEHRKALDNYIIEQEKKLVIVIASFDGPEDVYGMRNEIVENLNTIFAADNNTQIIPINEVVTYTNKAQVIQELENQFFADIVIWGWYRPTKNPNVTIYIENLAPDQFFWFSEFQSSNTYKPDTNIDELESFSFQQELGSETSSLISFLAGIIEFSYEDYSLANYYFTQSINVMIKPDITMVASLEDVYTFRALTWAQLQDFEQASEDCKNAMNLEPQKIRTYNFCSAIFHINDQVDWAVMCLTKSLELDPNNIENYRGRGIFYIDLEEYGLAIADLSHYISIDPERSDTYYYRGFAYFAADQYDNALADIDRSIDLEPDNPKSYNLRGRVYFVINEYDQALTDFTKVISLAPVFAQNYLESSDESDQAFAMDDLHEVIDAYFYRGGVYSSLENYDLAIADFTQAISLDENNADAYWARGLVYYQLEEFDESLADFSNSIAIESDNSGAYRDRSRVYNALGRFDDALLDINQAIALDENDVDAYLLRGSLYITLNQYDNAILDLNKAIIIDDKNAMAYLYLGQVYLLLEEYENSVFNATKSIQIDPNNTDSYLLRGTAYTMLTQYDSAMQDYNKVIDLEPDYPEGYHFRGMLYELLGQSEQAQIDIAKYTELMEDANP